MTNPLGIKDMKKASYLGDGLYIEDHDYSFRLFCERDNGIHEVFLEDVDLFLKFIEKMRNVTIKVTHNG